MTRVIRTLVHSALLLATMAAAGRAQARTVNIGDATINYELSGQGKTLVLVHGWALDLTVWEDQVPAFSTRYHVLRYDLRGFGKSTGFADTTAEPDDLRQLMDSLRIRSAYVLGWSRGARVALDFAVAFPDRVDALVLVGAPPPQGFQPAPVDSWVRLAEIARAHGLDSVWKLFRAGPLAWEPPDRPDIRARLARITRRYDGRDLLDPKPPSGRVPSAHMDQIAAIRIPTLIVVGDHEAPQFQLVADTLLRRMRSAKKVVIPNAGHGPPIHQPADFNKTVMGFLATVDRDRRP